MPASPTRIWYFDSLHVCLQRTEKQPEISPCCFRQIDNHGPVKRGNCPWLRSSQHKQSSFAVRIDHVSCNRQHSNCAELQSLKLNSCLKTFHRHRESAFMAAGSEDSSCCPSGSGRITFRFIAASTVIAVTSKNLTFAEVFSHTETTLVATHSALPRKLHNSPVHCTYQTKSNVRRKTLSTAAKTAR